MMRPLKFIFFLLFGINSVFSAQLLSFKLPWRPSPDRGHIHDIIDEHCSQALALMNSDYQQTHYANKSSNVAQEAANFGVGRGPEIEKALMGQRKVAIKLARRALQKLEGTEGLPPELMSALDLLRIEDPTGEKIHAFFEYSFASMVGAIYNSGTKKVLTSHETLLKTVMILSLYRSLDEYSLHIKNRTDEFLQKAYSINPYPKFTQELSRRAALTEPETDAILRPIETFLQDKSAQDTLLEDLDLDSSVDSTDEVRSFLDWIERADILKIAKPFLADYEEGVQFWANPSKENIQKLFKEGNAPLAGVPLYGPVDLWIRLSFAHLFGTKNIQVFLPRKKNIEFGDAMVVAPGFQISVWFKKGQTERSVEKVRIRFLSERDIISLIPQDKKQTQPIEALVYKNFQTEKPAVESVEKKNNLWLQDYAPLIRARFSLSEHLMEELREYLNGNETRFYAQLTKIKVDHPSEKEFLEIALATVTESFPEMISNQAQWPKLFNRLSQLKSGPETLDARLRIFMNQLRAATDSRISFFQTNRGYSPVVAPEGPRVPTLRSFSDGTLELNGLEANTRYEFTFTRRPQDGTQYCVISQEILEFLQSHPLLAPRILAIFQKGLVSERGVNGIKKLKTEQFFPLTHEIKFHGMPGHDRIGIIQQGNIWRLEKIFDPY
ncbi:MAG: hypothetical protein JWQ35_1235 [Bacteriovoracaceae bacterium]|nr:hypothetical protein [Bacteriovoracaceae bacterium]